MSREILWFHKAHLQKVQWNWLLKRQKTKLPNHSICRIPKMMHGGGVQYSFIRDEDGNTIVKADRDVLSGNDRKEWIK